MEVSYTEDVGIWKDIFFHGQRCRGAIAVKDGVVGREIDGFGVLVIGFSVFFLQVQRVTLCLQFIGSAQLGHDVELLYQIDVNINELK